MLSPQVVVVGSTNTDLVVTVPHFPSPGETVLGGNLRQVAGGKGANQAVAAARAGAAVTFIGRVGQDDYGTQTRSNLQAEGINTQFLSRTDGIASGVALISIQAETGENSIVVAPGANSSLQPADIAAAVEAFEAAQVVIVSLEIPIEAVQAAIELAKAKQRVVILNPAPARQLSDQILAQIDILTPNEKELGVLGGTAKLLQAGVKTIITTLGARGARVETNQGVFLVEAPVVSTVDTVAAGDCFSGALAVELASGSELRHAVQFAVAAASLKVCRHGAQTAMPTRQQVLEFQKTLATR